MFLPVQAGNKAWGEPGEGRTGQLRLLINLPRELSYPQQGPAEGLAAPAGQHSSLVWGASGQRGVPGHGQCPWARRLCLP